MLAVGLLGPGVAGRGVGRVALIVFGLRLPALLLQDAVALPAGTTPEPSPLLIVTTSAIDLLSTVALVVAAVAVLRAGVLRGAARWALVPLAAVQVVLTVVEQLPLPDLQLALLPLLALPVEPLALVVAGVLLLLHGRAESIRRRTRAALDAW